MFGISGSELLIILALVLIIFGPDKLPELSRTIGRAMAMFKRAQEDMERVIRAEMYTPDATSSTSSGGSASDPAPPKTPQPAAEAASIWAATDEDDEEDEE